MEPRAGVAQGPQGQSGQEMELGRSPGVPAAGMCRGGESGTESGTLAWGGRGVSGRGAKAQKAQVPPGSLAPKHRGTLVSVPACRTAWAGGQHRGFSPGDKLSPSHGSAGPVCIYSLIGEACVCWVYPSRPSEGGIWTLQGSVSGEGIAPDGASDAPSTLASGWALCVPTEGRKGRAEAFTELQWGCTQLHGAALRPLGGGRGPIQRPGVEECRGLWGWPPLP